MTYITVYNLLINSNCRIVILLERCRTEHSVSASNHCNSHVHGYGKKAYILKYLLDFKNNLIDIECATLYHPSMTYITVYNLAINSNYRILAAGNEIEFQENEIQFQESEIEFQENEIEFQENEIEFQENENELQENGIEFQVIKIELQDDEFK